jgi:hypothetical protein
MVTAFQVTRARQLWRAGTRVAAWRCGMPAPYLQATWRVAAWYGIAGLIATKHTAGVCPCVGRHAICHEHDNFCQVPRKLLEDMPARPYSRALC